VRIRGVWSVCGECYGGDHLPRGWHYPGSELTGCSAVLSDGASHALAEHHQFCCAGGGCGWRISGERSESIRDSRAAGFLPQFFPVPDAGGFVKQAIAKLVREHQDLPAMMRFVGEHVGVHGGVRRPGFCPTAAREFRDAAVGVCR
jgi:hypothetical protein